MMNVYFTVDTESSMGGAWRDPSRRPLPVDRHIFCRIGGRDHGIGLITDALDRFGFRATHFVETFMALVNGEGETRRVFDYLLERDQDVQLHLHPTYRFYAAWRAAYARGEHHQVPASNDLLSAFDQSDQQELIGDGVALFRRLTGRSPVAFRAGCFAADRVTLRALSQAGLVIDSSFNPCYPQWSFPGDDLVPNRTCRIDGIWEVPVTVARTPLPEGYGGLKHADPCALSVSELRTMLEHGAAVGQKHFVIIFHSFSAVKALDETYARVRPDRLVIRRLNGLLEYLCDRSDLYRVSTFGELAEQAVSEDRDDRRLAELPLLAAGWRKSAQVLNRFYWF